MDPAQQLTEAFTKLINIIDRLANKDNELERRIKALEDTINNS